jgi:hypothetical protein
VAAAEATHVHRQPPPSLTLVSSHTDPDHGRPEPLPVPRNDVPRALVGSDREQALLTAWREAHWSLRLTLQEVARTGHREVESLYAEARRCDNMLNELYRSRAELLARQVRDLLMSHTPPATRPGVAMSVPLLPSVSLPDAAEVALLARIRSLPPEDRQLLDSMVDRLTHRAAATRPLDR